MGGRSKPAVLGIGIPPALPYPDMPWYPTAVAARPPAEPRALSVAIGGRAIVLVAWADAWYALEDRCSHAGCAFSEDGVVEDGRMICECHGSEFDLATGAARRPPARVPIDTFEVRATASGLEVHVP
jgi:3-phenylpropionate/trans-cinnamate dioxygenase ferredoxin subunit